MRPQKRVLTCINDLDAAKVMGLLLQKWFAEQYDLSVTEARYIDKLLAQAEGETVDLFILLLNNMFYSDSKLCPESSRNGIESRLEINTRLKQTYHKPVIAMTGWPLSVDSWNEENTKQAGASFLLTYLPEGHLLREAVKQCLEEGEAVCRD